MLRRLAIGSLPLLAVAAVVAIVTRSEATPKSAVLHTTVIATLPPQPRRQRRHPALPALPQQVRGAAARRMPIPILMFHVIGTPKPGTPNLGLWVSPTTFAAEMAALHRSGYWAITLQRAWQAWAHGTSLPRKPVVVSFDDGYLGDYTHARPVLRQLGWPGVLNLELRNVRTGDIKAGEVRALVASGWEIDSHTIDHPDLTQVPDARLRWELVASRAQIRQRFASRADFFCYPAGRYDARVEAAVRAAGYRAATTEDEGWATAANLFALPRVRVQNTDTPTTLLQRLAAERPAV